MCSLNHAAQCGSWRCASRSPLNMQLLSILELRHLIYRIADLLLFRNINNCFWIYNAVLVAYCFPFLVQITEWEWDLFFNVIWFHCCFFTLPISAIEKWFLLLLFSFIMHSEVINDWFQTACTCLKMPLRGFHFDATKFQKSLRGLKCQTFLFFLLLVFLKLLLSVNK